MQVNDPCNILRPGLCGVPWWIMIDIDEAGYYDSASNPVYGHSLEGLPCRRVSKEKRGDAHWSICIAVDCTTGVQSRLIYPGGTTTDKFLVFIEFVVVPALAGGGPRVFTWDRLSAHFGEVEAILQRHGHYVVPRPGHSCDFGPVEWEFALCLWMCLWSALFSWLWFRMWSFCLYFPFLFLFHQHHDTAVNANNLKDAIDAALDVTTAEDIQGYFSCAHFQVPGFPYDPYMGL
jgi:hypothetical protein